MPLSTRHHATLFQGVLCVVTEEKSGATVSRIPFREPQEEALAGAPEGRVKGEAVTLWATAGS